MSEIITISILTLILITFIIYHVIMVKELNRQILELVKVNKAKTLTEYAVSDKVNKEDPVEQEPPEFIPAESIDENVFQKMIERQLEQDGIR